MNTTTVQATPAVKVDEKAALLARIAELEAKIERKERKAGNVTLGVYGKGHISVGVSTKGALSFYGFNARFPLTAYKSVVLFILDHAVAIRAFITANDAKLSQGKE